MADGTFSSVNVNCRAERNAWWACADDIRQNGLYILLLLLCLNPYNPKGLYVC